MGPKIIVVSPTYYVYISECESKNGSGEISVTRELKWHLRFEISRGKYNRVLREPE